MRDTILEAIRLTAQGTRKLKITFKPDAIGDLTYLRGMTDSHRVDLDLSDHAVVMAVMSSGEWEHDENRTMEVTMTDTFGPNFFVGRMERALEAIEVVVD